MISMVPDACTDVMKADGWGWCMTPTGIEEAFFGIEKDLADDVTFIIWGDGPWGFCIDRGETRLKQTTKDYATAEEAAQACKDAWAVIQAAPAPGEVAPS